MIDLFKANTDFLKTIERMYKDSRILYDKGEYYNCCYLCGYVLECALKYILLKFGRDESGNTFTVEQLKTQFAHRVIRLNDQLDNCILILSILVDTFCSRTSLSMPPIPKSHNTACVLS